GEKTSIVPIPGNRDAGCREDAAHGLGDFRPDAVTRNERNVMCHRRLWCPVLARLESPEVDITRSSLAGIPEEKHKAECYVDAQERGRGRVQPIVGDASLISGRQPLDRAGHLRPNLRELPRDESSRVNLETEHHDHDSQSDEEGGRWWPHELHHEQTEADDGAARISQDMQSSDEGADDRPRDRASTRRVCGFKHAEDRWSDHSTE